MVVSYGLAIDSLLPVKLANGGLIPTNTDSNKFIC